MAGLPSGEGVYGLIVQRGDRFGDQSSCKPNRWCGVDAGVGIGVWIRERSGVWSVVPHQECKVVRGWCEGAGGV